jgi:sortase A
VADLPITSPTDLSYAIGLGPMRRQPSRAVRWAAVLLLTIGALAVTDGIVTLLWQEPFSALIAKLRQDSLSGDLLRAEAASPTAAERSALASIASERHRIDFLARQTEHQTGDGGAVGRIVIPRIGANFVVVKGTDTADLESGPGIYSDTHFPGRAGTTAIAGHRTTYLAPFRHIDELPAGSQIRVNMTYAHFTYTVTGQRIVSPSDVQAAVAQVGYTRLVLSACTPLFSAAKRILLYARLTKTVPVGPALLLGSGVIARPIETSLRRRRRLHPVLESLNPHRVFPIITKRRPRLTV